MDKLNLRVRVGIAATGLCSVRNLYDPAYSGTLEAEAARLARGTPEPGAKGDPITVGGIVVALASAGVFTGLVELLKSWALRREGRTVTLKAKAGDQEVELTYSPAETSPEEMTQFVNTIMGTLRQGETATAGE